MFKRPRLIQCMYVCLVYLISIYERHNIYNASCKELEYSNLLYVVNIFELADDPAMHLEQRVLDVTHGVAVLHCLAHHRSNHCNGTLLTVFSLYTQIHTHTIIIIM